MDVVVLTIDCWRYDAIEEMPHLRASTAEYSTHDLICHAESTAGVFPTILASRYPFDAYSSDGIRPDISPLPQVLSEAGYETGAFVAGNPFLSGWQPCFDTFWNAGYEERDEDFSKLAAGASYLKRLLLFQQEIPGEEIGTRARQWFQTTDGPRFLWMHLMDPHEPYHPGFARARSQGLLRSWWALSEYRFRHPRTEEHLSDVTQSQIRRLYWESVKRLDDHIGRCLDFIPDDALVLIFGDHGEELHHGLFYHARLYDEVVRVPLLVRAPRTDGQLFSNISRQLNIAPTIAAELGVDIPASWEGTRDQRDVSPVYMSSQPNHPDANFVGFRTEEQKYIVRYSPDWETVEQREFYDLRSDSAEQNNLIDQYNLSEIIPDGFEKYLQRVIGHADDRQRTVSASAESRLKELGYL